MDSHDSQNGLQHIYWLSMVSYPNLEIDYGSEPFRTELLELMHISSGLVTLVVQNQH